MKKSYQESISLGKEEPEGLVVVESALLVGAGYEKRFDQLWYIYTREEVRYERLRASEDILMKNCTDDRKAAK